MTAVVVDVVNSVPNKLSLAELLAELPQRPQDYSFGLDIDEAHHELLSKTATDSQKIQCYLN